MGNDHDSRDTAATRIDLDAVYNIAIALGSASNTSIQAPTALDILDQHAQRAGIPTLEAANWLIATGTLL